MSYDTYICIETGGDEDSTLVEVGNHTANTSGMWFKAMPWREGMFTEPAKDNLKDLLGGDGRLGGIAGLHEMRCETALPIIQEGLEYMQKNRDQLLKYEPPNGWGNYASALGYLRQIHDACAEHPRAYIRVSW